MSAARETATADSDVRLTDVMLAMDVVDSLRHEEALVARALNADERERVLLERVRGAYEAQGIEVSDATLAAGVKALKEREFQYDPPPPGLRTRLFTAWVRRGRIGRGLGIFAAVGALVGGGYYGFVEVPQQRAELAVIESLNTGIATASVDIRTLDQRRVTLRDRLDNERNDRPGANVAAAFDMAIASTESRLADAAQSLTEASAVALGERLRAPGDPRRAVVAAALQQRENLLARAKQHLVRAEAGIATLASLRQLPVTLASLRDDAKQLAVPDSVDADIDAIYRNGITALRDGDPSGAEAATAELRAMADELRANYEISVVSRPGERSGVIRAPESNFSADNYYLIVEALDRDGRAQAVAIRSEEDGAVRTVTSWGVRVSAPVFERIRADKADDGIIQGRVIGDKRRGYLEPNYRIPVEGGMIHAW
ncbi:MAG: DUF6384 family protein [Pseudomonadota bacterium]